MTHEEDTMMLNLLAEVEEMNLPDEDAVEEIMSRISKVYMNLPKQDRNSFFEKNDKTALS